MVKTLKQSAGKVNCDVKPHAGVSLSAASSTLFCKEFHGCDLNTESLICVNLALHSLAFLESSVKVMIVDADLMLRYKCPLLMP